MSERYVRPTVGGWLRPTLIGPWLSVYGTVTAIAGLGIDRGLFGKVIGWTLGMVLGSVWAFVFCTLLVAVDLLLLAVRVRTLPSGRRGWATGLLAPPMVFAVYAVAPPYSFYPYGPWAVVGAVVAPMVVVAALTRLFAGQKTLRSR